MKQFYNTLGVFFIALAGLVISTSSFLFLGEATPPSRK